jgi:hypothetical protein
MSPEELEKGRATYSAGCAEDAANLVPDLIARIQELEDALVEERVIGEGGFRAEQCEFWYIEDLPEESCMELDGPCDWAKCPRKHELCDVAYQQLAEEGKIGPDAKPRSWKITDERKAAILNCKRMLTFLKEDDAPCYDVEKITKDESVLVAMLKEAERE